MKCTPDPGTVPPSGSFVDVSVVSQSEILPAGSKLTQPNSLQCPLATDAWIRTEFLLSEVRETRLRKNVHLLAWCAQLLLKRNSEAVT